MAKGGDLSGKTIGKCRILGRLGYGRTGSIYRAFYEPLGKEVAVKILRREARANRELRLKFMNEAKALGRLDHPGIVKVFDVVEEGPYLFIIMELLKGKDLYQVLEEAGHIEAEEGVEIVSRVAKALAEAHRQGIVHRDVKPANIMLVGPRGEVKLVDFGLATEGVTVGRAGTPHYMSPEQIQGKPVTEKSDIYALGATFFHMLTGQPPYPAKTAKVIREKHVEGNLPTPSRIGKSVGVPKAVDAVVKKMMAPIAGYRANARDLVELLGSLNLAAGGRRKKKRTLQAASNRGRHTLLIVGGVVAGVAIVAIVVAILLSGKKDEKPADVNRGETATGTGGGTGNSLIANRANDARAREVMAERMFKNARSFRDQNYGKDAEIRERFQEVWDKYGETVWGQKAQKEMKKTEEILNREKRNAERRKMRELLKKARPVLEKDLATLRAAFDFPGMYQRILAFLDEYDLEDADEMEWIIFLRRLAYADQLILDLGRNIKENTKKFEVTFFKKDGPKDTIIKSADADHVLLEQGTVEQKKPWGFFTAEEIGRMAGRQLNIRHAMTYYLLGNFYLVMGMKGEGEGNLENAIGMDSMGTIRALEKKLKEKPRGKISRKTPFGK